MIETNFKHTELGLIPHDWEVKAIHSIIDECSYGVGAEAVAYDGDVKYLRITDIEDDSHQYCPKPLTSPSFYSDLYLAKEGDLFIARTGASVGKSYLYNPKDGKLVYAGFLIKMHILEANPYFVFLNTFTQRYNNWIISESARTGQPGINAEQLKAFQIPLPPTLAEQEKIADALSKIDQLINDLGALIEKKKAIKQGTMQDLLTAKRRLKGFTGEWKEKQLKEICERYDNLRIPISAKLRKKGNTPYYGANGIQDYVEGYTHDGEFILIAEDGANSLTNYPIKYVIGKIWVNNHAHVITAKDEKTNNVYLSYALKCVDFESNIVGSGRAKLNADTLMQLSVVIPPTLAEQNAIANILSSMDTEITNLEQKRDKYIAIKQGMMQNLLTGKIRLI